MNFGSLFTGIGGIDLGLERAGMRCAWQVEIDPFCVRVLERHWPNVRRYDDVRTARPDPVDLICGGFPCQDLSHAGRRGGIGAEQSGLWWAFAGQVAWARPAWVLVENVHQAWRSWVPVVRSTLGGLGYWSIALRLRAVELGADHQRSRCFVVAHADRELLRDLSRRWSGARGEVATQPVDARWGTAASRMARVDDGLPNGVDRRRGLGNAVVPQAAEEVGRVIMSVASKRGGSE